MLRSVASDYLLWIFAGRFTIYILCIVLMWGSILDWFAWITGKAPKPIWTYHWMVIFGCMSIILATPDRYNVLQRLFHWHPGDAEVGLLLFAGLVCAASFFVLAQVTRAYNRGASPRRIKRGVWLAIIGIAITAMIGAGIDVRFP